MLTVKTLQESKRIITNRFGHLRMDVEKLPLNELVGRYLAVDVVSDEFVPAFDRSTVDGFAVISRDLVGCSESIPAILRKAGESVMGTMPVHTLMAGECFYVPTGGALPQRADAMVMIEFVEDFGAGDYGFIKAVAPGANMIFKGEDLRPGDKILEKGKKLTAADIGTLAAMGVTEIEVYKRPRIAVISTGDELVPFNKELPAGKIRDVNTPMLSSLIEGKGSIAISFPIIPDKKEQLRVAMCDAVREADVLLVSGGTSVGEHDNLPTLIEELGEVFVHGIAIKPGKPTVIGQIDGKPVIGLPGNPVAAFFMFHLLVKGLIAGLQGGRTDLVPIELTLSRAISSNHGREEVVLVKIETGTAIPVPSKSGLISTVSLADGFILIPREQEGLPKGARVQAYLL
ncbi:MAG: gephyrin-like molybdotransferase Glp [Anaerolineaceae bacterium]